MKSFKFKIHYPYCTQIEKTQLVTLNETPEKTTFQLPPSNNRYRRRISDPVSTVTITTERLKRLNLTNCYNFKPKEIQQEYGAQLNAMLTDEALKAMDAIEYITQHLRRKNEHKKVFIKKNFFLKIFLDSRRMEICSNGN